MYVWFIMTWEGCFRSFDKDTRTLTLSLSLGKADWFDFIVICCSLPYYALHCTIPTHTHTRTRSSSFIPIQFRSFSVCFFLPLLFNGAVAGFVFFYLDLLYGFIFRCNFWREWQREREIKSALVGCERVSIVTEPFLVLYNAALFVIFASRRFLYMYVWPIAATLYQ